jgi:pimeloyl-[acyl-carrier protein] methyl ester esterase
LAGVTDGVPAPTQSLRLVLLPGFDGSARLFEPFIRSIGDAVVSETVAFPPDPHWGYEELLPFVVGRLPDGVCILLGESFSGPLAVMAAASAPQRVAAIVLVSSFSRLPVPVLLARMAGRFGGQAIPRWLLEGLLTSRETPHGVRAELFEQVKMLPADLVAKRLRAALSVDVGGQLDALNRPILALQGRQDRLIPPWWARHDLGRRPGVELHFIDGPHMLLQTVPSAVAVCLRSWIGRRSLWPSD